MATLRRIAFLLEARARGHLSQAYRNAAAAILPLPPDQVAAATADGTLTDLPGSGPAPRR